MKSKKRVVVVGGGTGTYTTLLGLKKYSINPSVIVTMTDSGGSNRVIRDEFGLLPTSDIRQAIVALSDTNSNGLLRDLFTYRYSQGTGISGMTFGNLFMAALTDILGSQSEAIDKTCKLFNVQGDIIPVTYNNSHLVARYDNGQQVLGEHEIDEPASDVLGHRIIDLELIPKAVSNPKAIKSIEEANLIIFSPGDLYTSLLCNLVVGNISKSIAKSKAKKVLVVNLMTKNGQTNGFKASDFLKEVNKYLGGNYIDYVIINNNLKFKDKIIRRYHQENAEVVIYDLEPIPYKNLKVYRKDLVSSQIYKKPKSDHLVRSLVRHDPDKLAKAILSLL